MANVIIETIQRIVNMPAIKSTPLAAFDGYAWHDFMCDPTISPTINCDKDNLEYALPVNDRSYIAKFRKHPLDGYYLTTLTELQPPPILPFDEVPEPISLNSIFPNPKDWAIGEDDD